MARVTDSPRRSRRSRARPRPSRRPHARRRRAAADAAAAAPPPKRPAEAKGAHATPGPDEFWRVYRRWHPRRRAPRSAASSGGAAASARHAAAVGGPRRRCTSAVAERPGDGAVDRRRRVRRAQPGPRRAGRRSPSRARPAARRASAILLNRETDEVAREGPPRPKTPSATPPRAAAASGPRSSSHGDARAAGRAERAPAGRQRRLPCRSRGAGGRAGAQVARGQRLERPRPRRAPKGEAQGGPPEAPTCAPVFCSPPPAIRGQARSASQTPRVAATRLPHTRTQHTWIAAATTRVWGLASARKDT